MLLEIVRGASAISPNHCRTPARHACTGSAQEARNCLDRLVGELASASALEGLSYRSGLLTNCGYSFMCL
jgi:hypothetical protein